MPTYKTYSRFGSVFGLTVRDSVSDNVTGACAKATVDIANTSIHTAKPIPPAVSQVRLLVRLGANASADFIELHRSRGAADHFASIVCELELEAGARAKYVKIQQRDEQLAGVGVVLPDRSGQEHDHEGDRRHHHRD